MADTKSTTPPIKSVIELLEEDDEFEVSFSYDFKNILISQSFHCIIIIIIIIYLQEFDSNWNVTEEAEDVQLWQDDWDDDDVRDEFTDQLRQKVETSTANPSTTTKS